MTLNMKSLGVSRAANVIRRAGSACLAAMLCSIIATPAKAGTYDGAMGRSKYVVVTGDVNGDGQNDILFKAAAAKLVMIPLDDDLMVPILIASPSPSFALISTSYGVYSLVLNPGAEIISAAAWQPATQQITYSGVTGSYADSATITAVSNEQASFLVAMMLDGRIQIISTTAPAVNTGAQPAPPTSPPTTPPPSGPPSMVPPPSIAPHATPLPPLSCDE
ncbi:MAG: hypothetical protein V4631_11335 [Pseudomonadota bacterium]